MYKWVLSHTLLSIFLILRNVSFLQTLVKVKRPPSPNYKLNDWEYIKLEYGSDLIKYNKRKRNWKVGYVKHFALYYLMGQEVWVDTYTYADVDTDTDINHSHFLKHIPDN